MSLPLTSWELTPYLAMSLFGLGLAGFLIHRNALVILMSLELMLNAVNILFVQASLAWNDSSGIIFVVFIITIAAAEVAIGLGLILNMYRKSHTVEMDAANLLQG